MIIKLINGKPKNKHTVAKTLANSVKLFQFLISKIMEKIYIIMFTNNTTANTPILNPKIVFWSSLSPSPDLE